jgi:hypothetical protein
VVELDDALGDLGRVDVVHGLADQLGAGAADELLVGLVDEGELLRLRLLDDQRHRDVLDDDIEKVLG